MKKTILFALCCCVLLPLASQEKKEQEKKTVPAIVIPNGDMKLPGKAKIQGKEVDFVKNWAAYGPGWSVTKNDSDSYDVHTKGCFEGGFGVPKGCPEGYDYKLTVTAKGKSLALRTWSWEGYKPRTNHRRLSLPVKYKLTDEFKEYVFTFPCLPKEAYMVLWIDGDKTIRSVKCELVPAEAKKEETVKK